MQERVEQTADLEKLGPILRELPLEKCSFEQDPITKEWGWRAPKGFAFKVTGQFIIDSGQSDITYWYGPQQSADMFKAENADLYKRLLEEANGNEEEAMDELKWEKDISHFEEFPEEFIGKWLTISFERGLNGEIETDRERKHPVVVVKSDIEAWYNRGDNNRLLDNITAGTGKKTTVLVTDDTIGFEVWKQYFAKASLGFCRIELVEIEEKEQQLYVPHAGENDGKLTTAKLGEEAFVSNESPKGKEWSFDPKIGDFIVWRGPLDLILVMQRKGVATAKDLDDPDIKKSVGQDQKRKKKK